MTILFSTAAEAKDDVLNLLLAEQQHRFSNSFQVVAACANQIHRDTGGPIDTERMVRDLMDRIQTLSALHRLLGEQYRMEDFADHVRQIARLLVRSFDRNDAVVLRTERFYIRPDRRTRLALLVNELVTNSLKHSLGTSPTGLIEILARRWDANVTIVVSDSNKPPLNGVLPKPSRIVAELAASLGGVADVVDNQGYTAIVHLPVDDRGARMPIVEASPMASITPIMEVAPCR